jgi:hypothetical protein
MISRRDFLIKSGAIAGGCLVVPRLAHALPTVISSIPAVITSSGSYVLSQNHTVNLSQGAAIEVQADNVEIDLAGYTIDNTSVGIGTFAVGIFAQDKIAVTVKNGTLQGFHSGVFLYGPLLRSERHVVDSLDIDDFTASGIVVAGDSCSVKNNTLTTSARTNAFSILSCSTAVMGIGLYQATGTLLIDNSISLGNAGANDFTLGVFVGRQSSAVVVLGTSITNADVGIVFDEDFDAIGEVKDTVTSGVTRLLVGGIDLGNNA